jgi:hypothetical protein
MTRIRVERGHLERVIWARAVDIVRSAASSRVCLCSYARRLFDVYVWVDESFLHGAALNARTQRDVHHFLHQLRLQETDMDDFDCTLQCKRIWRTQLARFVSSFRSYSAAIVELHQAHKEGLANVRACCALPMDDLAALAVDLSTHIFQSLNFQLFDNRLRIHQATNARHVLRWAQEGVCPLPAMWMGGSTSVPVLPGPLPFFSLTPSIPFSSANPVVATATGLDYLDVAAAAATHPELADVDVDLDVDAFDVDDDETDLAGVDIVFLQPSSWPDEDEDEYKGEDAHDV